MNIKRVLGLVLLGFSINTVQAAGGFSIGHEAFSFDTEDRANNNALGNYEADKSPNYQLSAWATNQLNEDLNYAVLGYYEDHNLSGNVSTPLDDSYTSALAIQTSVYKNFNADSLAGATLSYTSQKEKESANNITEEVGRDSVALDISIAKQVDKTTYLATLGHYKNLSADKDSGGSAQRHADDTTYFGLAVDHEYNKQFDIGATVSIFNGKTKDEGSATESGKEADFYDLYGRYKMSDYQVKFGYSIRDFDDKSDNEWMKGKGVYAELTIPFGGTVDKKTTMFVTQKPKFWQHDGYTSGQLE